MKNFNFPVFKTKIKGLNKTFNLSDPEQSRAYFDAKAGKEIEKLRDFLKENSFIAYLLGKKSSGKGTYSKMFRQIVAKDLIECFSIGDMIRDLDKDLLDPEKKKELISFLKNNYRGYLPLPEILASLEKRSTKTLLPTELILALVKKQIAQKEKKTLFIDGFPRNLDQVSYSLFFRDLVGYRDDPDVLVLIDVPESVIEARIKNRVVCPKCHTPKNLKLFRTKEVKYDEQTKDFYFLCDNPECQGARMVFKEGDKLGLEPIRQRLDTDQELIGRAFSLYGIPKALLRNSVPIKMADDYVDDYEITPMYKYERDERAGNVKVIEKPWQIKDDEGIDCFSLLPQPVVVSMIKQVCGALGL